MTSGFPEQNNRPTIDSLTFDTSAWKYHAEKQPGKMRLWETPEHDAVVLHFFGIPPDLPRGASAAELSAFYAKGLDGSSAKIVECTLGTVADCPAIQLLVKVPQKPSGMMYQMGVTLPFRDFSFVVKIQCQEHGITGTREAILFAERLKAGEKPNVTGGPFLPNWNPDSPEYDKRFPDHPVSRLRRLLAAIKGTAKMDATVRTLPAFDLPESAT